MEKLACGDICAKNMFSCFLHVSQHFQSEMFNVVLKSCFVLSERDERETDMLLHLLLYILSQFRY